MKYLSIPISDEDFEVFDKIQKKHKFRNQSDTLSHLIQKCKSEVEGEVK